MSAGKYGGGRDTWGGITTTQKTEQLAGSGSDPKEIDVTGDQTQLSVIVTETAWWVFSTKGDAASAGTKIGNKDAVRIPAETVLHLPVAGNTANSFYIRADSASPLADSLSYWFDEER